LNKYQVITDYRRSDYLAKISQKLSSAAGLNAPIDISILKTEMPLAFSISNGDIFVSTGFIHQLIDEESFVFILAHELSHALLEHHQAAQPEPDFELAADSLALNIILRAGYPAQSVFPTLVNSYSAGFIGRYDSISSIFGTNELIHPPLQERISNLNETFNRFDLSARDIQEIAFGNNSEEYFNFSSKLQS
jgi:Zn-dependent protease with chaperone function